MPVGTAREALVLTASPVRTRDVILSAFAALLVLAIGLMRPHYNWDMVGYVASALSADGYHGADLSTATYESLRNNVSATRFDQMLEGNYCCTVYRDPPSLARRLPFCRMRVMYAATTVAVGLVGQLQTRPQSHADRPDCARPLPLPSPFEKWIQARWRPNKDLG
jgi:hypothetical protein